MTDPLDALSEVVEALDVAAREARTYLGNLNTDPVAPAGAEALAEEAFSGRLPDAGLGTQDTIAELAALAQAAATRSSGPRFFHWVTGGATPAALAADWLASALDQQAFAWDGSPLSAACERQALAWLLDMFELPADFEGVITSGATMANFSCLAAARDWWGERSGIDVRDAGLSGAPVMPVLGGGYVHPSARQAVGMLGCGLDAVHMHAADARGRLDLGSLEAELRSLDGAPAVIIGTAGEVNAGECDPIDALADLAERYGAWLHVDGAFGLFARLVPEAAHLAAGAERAHSITVDGHKWLNVPYDCGFAFVREPGRLARAFAVTAAYLPQADDPRPNFGLRAPENSRRARGFAVWATLRAYGREGHRAMVARHLRLAQHLAATVDAHPDFERLADVPLNIVCFRHRPPDVAEGDLDEHNRALGVALLRDGRVFAGTTEFEGKVAFRPAIVNWRTTEADVELLVTVLAELAETL